MKVALKITLLSFWIHTMIIAISKEISIVLLEKTFENLQPEHLEDLRFKCVYWGWSGAGMGSRIRVQPILEACPASNLSDYVPAL
jgi:hypothetical protein